MKYQRKGNVIYLENDKNNSINDSLPFQDQSQESKNPNQYENPLEKNPAADFQTVYDRVEKAEGEMLILMAKRRKEGKELTLEEMFEMIDTLESN